jgi:hypothetical protein
VRVRDRPLADPFAGIAPGLIRQGIPAVIAMQFEVTDTAAAIFGHEFYLALADGCPVDQAAAEARKAMYASDCDVEWATPVLYLRASDGRIFDTPSIDRSARGRLVCAGSAPRGQAESLDQGSEPPSPPATVLDDDVQFTVYRPTEIAPDNWHPLLVFAHRTTPVLRRDGRVIDPVAEVSQQAQTLLAAEAGPYAGVSADSATGIARGVELLFEPWLTNGQFNPSRATLRWEEPVHRVEFRLRVPASTSGLRLTGGLRVFLGVVLIGEVTFRVEVRPARPVVAPPVEPLHVRRYRHIFASYSHKDADVVRRVSDVVSVTGDRYLVDVQDLRSGELWEPRIAELIEEADLFQLFWSTNAMTSKFVRKEWEHALGLGRSEFIRPFYWEDPLPSDPMRGLPPDALRRVHFARLPSSRTGTIPTVEYSHAAHARWSEPDVHTLPPANTPPPSPSRPSGPVLPSKSMEKRAERRPLRAGSPSNIVAAGLVTLVVLALVVFLKAW